MKIAIKGSDKRIKELKSYISLYLKKKGLSIIDIDDSALKAKNTKLNAELEAAKAELKGLKAAKSKVEGLKAELEGLKANKV